MTWNLKSLVVYMRLNIYFCEFSGVSCILIFFVVNIYIVQLHSKWKLERWISEALSLSFFNYEAFIKRD